MTQRAGLRRWLLAALLGLAGLWLNTLAVPILTEETPQFVFGGAPVLLAFVWLGAGPGLLAGVVSLVVIWTTAPAIEGATAVYLVEALLVTRLRRRSGSLIFAELAYWLTAGALLDLAVYGWVFGLSRDVLAMLFVKQVLNGVLNAVAVETLLLLPWLGARLDSGGQPLALREYVFRRVALAVMAPALALALFYARSSYDRELDSAARRGQAAARSVRQTVHEFFEVRGQLLELAAREVELRAATPGLEPLGRLAQRPDVHFAGTVDAHGRVASLFGSARGADVPVPGAPFPFAAELREAADGPGPIFAGRALWDRTGAATAEPAVLVVVPLLSAPGVRAGAAFAAFCMGPVVQHLVSARSQESQLITLFDATRSVIASLDPRLRPSRALGSHYPVSALGADPGTFAYYPPPDDSLASRVALDLRRSAYEPVDPPGWGVVVDVPAETLHASVAPHAARILLFLGLTLALLYAAVAVLARQVAVPLQRVDETAARIAAGRYESDPGLAELVRSPIAELRHLAAHFLRMEQALAAHDEEAVTALRESEERYRRVVELSPDAIVVETEAGISFLNAAALRLLGLQGGEQAIGRSIASFMHAEDVDFGRLAIAKCLALAPPFSSQRRFVHTEGSVRSAEIAVTAFQHGGRPAVLIVARDVTERQRAEEERERYQAAIQQAAQEWRETFDAIDSPVVLVDRRGNAARLNRAACQLSGHGFEDALGRPLAFLGAGSPWREACELAERVRAGGATEVANVSDPASERSWELTASRVPTAGEGGVRVILVARDTTALVRLQDSLRRRETMSAMGALVAGVAHEVRNPLFAISATLDAAELRLAGLPEARPHVQILRREVQRLSDLMEDLLDYGRPQGQELRPGPIRPVVHEAVALLNAQLVEIGVGVDVVCPEDLPQVAMDRRRLLQVFKNLVENAVYHAPRGSRVSVSLAAQDGPRPHIECAVRDSGKGFTPEDLDRVFEPFYTRRRGGTGLGLSIVQRIVEEHGGSVSVRNRPEGGAEVVTRLPVAAAAAHAPSAR